MGNQQTQHPHPPSYYSVEYLSGSTGTSVPDIIMNREYSTSSSGSIIEQSCHNIEANNRDDDDEHETHETLSSTIIQPQKMCTIQRSKSYVRPENKVLPGEMPTKPLRKTNYLQTDGHKRTWRHKSNKKNGGKNFSPDCSHLSMPEIYSFGKKGNLNRSDSESSDDWKRPSSIAAIRDQRHIMQNEIKNFRDKYSRSMDNLEEWTADDKLPYDFKIEYGNTQKTSEKNLGFCRKMFNAQSKSNSKHNFHIAEAETKKGKGYKIDPVRVQPLTCTPNEKVTKKHFLSRPPHLTSTPTNLDRDPNLSFVNSESKKSDKNSGILVKKKKPSNGSKEVRKSVDFCLEKELENDKSFVSKTSNGTEKHLSDKKASNLKQNSNSEDIVGGKKKSKSKSPSQSNDNKSVDTITKAKAILLQSKRRQLMEQSINESLDLPEVVTSKKCEKNGIKKGKLKSKSFLVQDADKLKDDSIKSKFGIRSIRQRKKEDRVKIIDLEKDIQIISRFPINSKVYRHYIGSGSACDKLSSSYNTAKMVENEDNKILGQSFVSLDSSDVNERGIDVSYVDENKKEPNVNNNKKIKSDGEKVKEKKTVIESLNQVFDPIYDSIDEYQSNRNQQAKIIVKVEKLETKNPPSAYENDQKNVTKSHQQPSQDSYSSFSKSSTTSFKPIAKVNPTTTNSNNEIKVKPNQVQNLQSIDNHRTQVEKNVNSSNSNNISSIANNMPNSNNNNKNVVQVVCPNFSSAKNKINSNNFQAIISKFDALQANEFHYTPEHVNNNLNDLSNKNDALRINSHINRKCSMSSDKLEPIFEVSTNKILLSESHHYNNNKVRRKSTIEITNNQRLNEKLQDEIQRAYEERTKRFNQVKMALRSNSIISNSSYSQIFPTSRSPSQLISPSNQDLRIKITNQMNERQLQPHITTINIASPLPSPPILPPNMHKLQYSVSSCSSVPSLPPPPLLPPILMQQQFNYESIIINENKHSDANTKDDDDCNDELNKLRLNTKLHNKPQEQEEQQKQQNALNRSSIGTTTSSLSSTTTNSSTSSSSSSLSSVDLASDKYYSIVDKNRIEKEALLLNKNEKSSQKQIQNIFEICTSELAGMDDNFSCKHKGGKVEQDNFILKSKPSTEYTCSNKSFKVNHDEYEKRNLYKKENNSEPIKSLPKNRRKALEEVFPDLKPAIQEAQKHVQIFNSSQFIENSEEDEDNYKEEDEEKNDNIQFKAVQHGIDKFRINDPDWCPASDLGDFDLDDFESKANAVNLNENTNLEETRPRKKTKHSPSFLSQAKPDIKDSVIKPNMISKPIPIHIKSTKRSFHSDSQSPIFSKIQTKLSSFENALNKSNDKNFIPCSLAVEGGVNRIISNTCTFDNSIESNKKWSTKNEANLKMTSNINSATTNSKCKFEIILYPFTNLTSYDPNNNNNNNINSNVKCSEASSTDNDYDFLHGADDSTTITDTTIKPLSCNNDDNTTFSILSNENADSGLYVNTQKNYRTLIKMKNEVNYASSSDDETFNALIREQNRRTCEIEKHRKCDKQSQDMKQIETNLKNHNKIVNDNKYTNKSHHELDAILYETDRKSSVSDGKRNPIYYSSSNESVYGSLM